MNAHQRRKERRNRWTKPVTLTITQPRALGDLVKSWFVPGTPLIQAEKPFKAKLPDNWVNPHMVAATQVALPR